MSRVAYVTLFVPQCVVQDFRHLRFAQLSRVTGSQRPNSILALLQSLNQNLGRVFSRRDIFLTFGRPFVEPCYGFWWWIAMWAIPTAITHFLVRDLCSRTHIPL